VVKAKNVSVTDAVRDPVQVGTATVAVIEEARLKRSDSITLGIPTVDKDFVPAKASDLIAIVGYTSNGKSMLANSIARYHAERLGKTGTGKEIVISITWEQSIEDQGIGDISNITHIPMNKIASGNFSDQEFGQILEASDRRGKMPWWLIGHSALERKRRFRLSMDEVFDCIDWIVNQVGMDPQLIVLDYLQRIRRVKADLREGYMDIVDDAKDLPYNFRIPTILVSQSKRDVYSREWGLPDLDDGQETSNLEQSSDRYISVWKVGQRHPIGHPVIRGKQAWLTTDDLFILGLMKNKQGRAPVVYGLRMDWTTGNIMGEYEHIDAATLDKKAKAKWERKP